MPDPIAPTPAPAIPLPPPIITPARPNRGETGPWAYSKQQLASRLGSSYDIITEALKVPGCPGRTGSAYNVPAWAEWLPTVGPIGAAKKGRGAASPDRPVQLRAAEERAGLARVQRERLQFKLQVEKGLYILREHATKDAADKFSEVRRALMQLPGTLAPIVITCKDAPAAERLLQEEIARTLLALSNPAPPISLHA